ncbi:MAG: exodeoxyribonuclease III [Clostridia bacterium]|nr:exodeoxyribonuclease III [Clostridia bacterium]
MKLVSWNVAGLRACLKKGFLEFLNEINADVVCIQETKMEKEQLDISFEGYYDYWNSATKKGYSGTLVLTKTKPISVTYGMGIVEHDDEGRIITVEYDDFYLVNLYTPNVKRELERLPYRMIWEDTFRKYLKDLEKTKPVVICGDFNVAHNEIDIKNYKQNIGNAGFTYEERGKFSELLDAGFIDTFRHIYPEKTDAYTWWSYMFNARAKNVGWRIDYFVVSNELKGKIKDAYIYGDVLGSDHCPIGLDIF